MTDARKERTAAEALCETLAGLGVEVLFGHPGGAILPFYDALHRAGRPRHVLVRHEQAAAHAADGYARATGGVGVCVSTSGPGATNLVTGLATAMMDSVPVVAVTGQVPHGALGGDAFQETDIVGVTMPVTKHGYLVDDPAELPRVVAEAFRLARSGRPGPVLVDIPKDVQAAPCPREITLSAFPAPEETESPTGNGVGRVNGRGTEASRMNGNGAKPPASAGGAPATGARLPAVPEGGIRRAAELLNGAQRPVIMAGRGVVLAGAAEDLRRLAERARAPVVTTLLGLDAFPATHPLATGMPGMHGTERANRAIQAADVVVGLGLRFDDRVTGDPETFARDAALVHFDIDPVAIGRTVTPDLAVLGDLGETLPALLEETRSRRRARWWARLGGWSREAAPAEEGDPPPASSPLSGRRAIRGLAARIAGAGATVVTDVGQHQMWLAQELRDAAPGTHLTSGGLGTMGYALPAGLGAAVGRPERPTWIVAGDGGFQMTIQELATAVQEGIPLRIAVVNNGFLGMVRQWQELFYERRYAATELTGPDLVHLAAAYGIAGRAVERDGDLEEALDWAEAAPGPVLLDLRVLPEENVYPMVPSGAAIDEMVDAPDVRVPA